MKHDPRLCPVCNKLLLKQDRHRFVLVTRCDQCNSLVHDRCYLDHHLNEHKLIGIITELERDQKEILYEFDSEIQ